MKKKILWLGVFLFGIFCITGCQSTSTSKNHTMTCKRTMNQNGMKTDLTYNIIYSGKYVNQVKSVETVETEASEVLRTYQEQIEKIYSPYKDIKYYNYNVNIDGNKLTSIVDIDYSKIDTDKLIEIDSANGNIIKDGKIKLDDIKSLYEQLGATCEKK